MQAQLRHDPARGAGCGVIDLEGFDGQDVDVQFSLCRASDGKYLGSGGDWLEAEQRLEPDMAQFQGGALRLLVGPAVMDMLDASDTFALTAYPAAGESRRCALDIGELAYSAPAGGQGESRPTSAQPVMPSKAERRLAPAPKPQPEPQPSPPAPEPLPPPALEMEAEPEPEPEPEQPLPALKDPVNPWRLESAWWRGRPLPVLKYPAKPRRKAPLIPLLLLALACAAGGIYWLQTESARPATRAAASAAKSASSAVAASKAAPFVQRARTLLRGGVSPDEAMKLARDMQTPEGADGAFLLLEDAAQKGKPEAMLILARFYDPTDAAPKGSIQADPEQARDWYNKAREGGQEAADDRLKALRAWAEAEKDRDPQAKKLLESWK